jgi:hypothetical protein
MSLLSFLFGGKPAPAANSYTTGANTLPQWLSDYSQGVLSQANAVGQTPYQTYPGQRIAGLTDDQLAGMNMVRGTVNQAPTAIQGALNAPGALATSAPYMATAAQQWPDQASRYMNPYITNVTDRAAQLTNRALNESLLPSLARTFGGAGGQDVRSSAYLREANRGTRDLAESLQSQNLAALAQGYETAGSQFASDASRAAGLAGTAGNLALADRTNTGNLAQALQQAQLTGAGALGTVGATIQGQEQKNLDTAYQDFLAQRDYPKTQLSWMAGLPGQLPSDQGVTRATSAPGSNFQPSGLAQLGTLATGIGGLMSGFKTGQNVTTGDANIDPRTYMRKGGRLKSRRRYSTGGNLRYAHAA